MNQTDGTTAKALDELSRLLQVDLEDVRWQQEKAASAALLAEPSYWQLMLAVKDWAKAVAHKCRQCSREYAKLYADEPDPVMETIKTLLFVLCDHLRLPANPLLLLRPEAEDWPESNAVSDFVLQVTEAPTQLVDGCLVTTDSVNASLDGSRKADLAG
jgi:hypothetical protein